MQSITTARVRELDAKHGSKVRTLMRCLSLSTIDSNKGASALSAMANQLGIPVQEFSSYVRVKLYAHTRATSVEITADPKLVADQIDMPVDEFYELLGEQAEMFDHEAVDGIDYSFDPFLLDSVAEDLGTGGGAISLRDLLEEAGDLTLPPDNE